MGKKLVQCKYNQIELISLFCSVCGHCAVSLTSWFQRESRISEEVKPESLGRDRFNLSFPFKMTYHISSFIALHMVVELSGHTGIHIGCVNQKESAHKICERLF